MQNDKLRELLLSQNFDELTKEFSHISTEQAQVFLSTLDDELLLSLLRGLDSEDTADFLVEMDDVSIKERIISLLPDRELEEVMEEVSIEDTVDLIEEMPTDVVRRIAETEEILRLIEARNFTVLKPLLRELNPTDLGAVFDEVPKADVALIFRLLPKELAAETFVELDGDSKEALIKLLNDRELKAVMDELFLDDTVDLIEEMPANVVHRIIAQSDAETRSFINEILKYPKDTAGSMMTIEFVSLNQNTTVGEAFERIRKTGVDKETIYTMYVTDEKRKLIGIVSAKQLLLAPTTAKIDDIMEDNVICVDTLTDKEDVSRMIAKYGFLAMPVVDSEQRLVGIVTVDDAMQVLQEENTEDIAKMSAVTPSDKPYLKTGVLQIFLNRLPWLLILMISATFSGLIISANEQTLNMPVFGIILTACIPMLTGTGGNAGSQASAMVIRGIALGEIEFKDTWKVVWKEVRVSILLGIVLAIACFGKLMIVDSLWQIENGFIVALVICISMLITVIIAKLIGAILPLLAKKLHLDPAVVASPFITTIVDVLCLTIYCWVAIALLGTL
ncbi:MAG: magnesium transporter [Clostridia bacterium]|nr:magnesium transporter [Clostridia bacterium]